MNLITSQKLVWNRKLILKRFCLLTTEKFLKILMSMKTLICTNYLGWLMTTNFVTEGIDLDDDKKKYSLNRGVDNSIRIYMVEIIFGKRKGMISWVLKIVWLVVIMDMVIIMVNDSVRMNFLLIVNWLPNCMQTTSLFHSYKWRQKFWITNWSCAKSTL